MDRVAECTWYFSSTTWYEWLHSLRDLISPSGLSSVFLPSLCAESQDFHPPKTTDLRSKFQKALRQTGRWLEFRSSAVSQKDRRDGTNIEVEAPLRRNSWYYQDCKCWNYWDFSPTPFIHPYYSSLTIWYPTSSNIYNLWIFVEYVSLNVGPLRPSLFDKLFPRSSIMMLCSWFHRWSVAQVFDVLLEMNRCAGDVWIWCFGNAISNDVLEPWCVMVVSVLVIATKYIWFRDWRIFGWTKTGGPYLC